jgi:hypothetical protein
MSLRKVTMKYGSLVVSIRHDTTGIWGFRYELTLGIGVLKIMAYKNPAKDFCSGDLNVRPCVCVSVLVANGSLDLAARAIVLQAFLFD